MVDKKIIITAVVIIVVAVIGITGIALQNKTTSQGDVSKNKSLASAKEEVVTLKGTGYTGPGKLATNGVVRYAEESGYIKGIKIDYLEITQDLQPVALSTGELDFGHMSFLTISRAVSQGMKIKAVALAHGSSPGPYFEFYVLDDSPIKSAKDLKGKKIGASKSSSVYQFLTEYLKTGNLTIDDVQLVTIPSGTAEQVLRARQVDVITQSFDGDKGAMLERGGVRLLFQETDVTPKDFFHCGLVVSEKFIKEKPELLNRFLEGFVKAADWERDNPDKTKELYAKWADNDGIKGGSEKILKYYRPSNKREHSLIKDSEIQWFIDRMVESGELKPRQVKPSDVYTNEFNPYFKK